MDSWKDLFSIRRGWEFNWIEWAKTLGLFMVWLVLGYLALFSLGRYRKAPPETN